MLEYVSSLKTPKNKRRTNGSAANNASIERGVDERRVVDRYTSCSFFASQHFGRHGDFSSVLRSRPIRPRLRFCFRDSGPRPLREVHGGTDDRRGEIQVISTPPPTNGRILRSERIQVRPSRANSSRLHAVELILTGVEALSSKLGFLRSFALSLPLSISSTLSVCLESQLSSLLNPKPFRPKFIVLSFFYLRRSRRSRRASFFCLGLYFIRDSLGPAIDHRASLIMNL